MIAGVPVPLVAAPMAGGPSTPALVAAVARAGGLGFLAGGYLTTSTLASRIAEVRSAVTTFGVNLFVPTPVPIAPDAFAAYARLLRPLADEYGLDLATAPREDDDDWRSKLDLLIADPVPVVSFTFGIPDAATVNALRRAGSVTVQSVTTTDEARAAQEAGLDVLVVQSHRAGGHSAATDPHLNPPVVSLRELVGRVRAVSSLPVWATGGVSRADQVRELLASGAEAVAVGTVLLRCEESGTSPVHRAALADPGRTGTVVTTSFSGRPARALRNGFTDRFHDVAPLGYPAVHHLTSPLRKAASAAGNPEHVNLWAGEGWRDALEEPVAETFARLAP